MQMVMFTDFLLADILTSLAKPMSDLGLAFCHLASRRPLLLSLQQGFDPGAHSCGDYELVCVGVPCLA
jgi:EXS family